MQKPTLTTRVRRAAAFVALLAVSCLTLSRPAGAESAPERVIVLGGSLTEIVFALGQEDRLAGVDDTSFYPPAANALPKVGYFRRLSAEGVLSLSPDLIIADAVAGPPTAIEQIASAGVRIEIAPEIAGFDGVLAKVRFLGGLFGVEAEAERLATKLAAEMEAADAEIAELSAAFEAPPRVIVVLSAQGGGLVAAGEDTAAAEMLAIVGAENATGGYRGYRPLSAEAAVAAAPDAIIAPIHAIEAIGGVDALLARPEIAATPAGRDRRVIVMDGLLLLGFGPRTPQGARDLAAALYVD